jgi:hypothetical protein
MHKGLKEPHLFNAASNPFKIIRNLAGILLVTELDKIRAEVDANVVGLFRLGQVHFVFARSVPAAEWRQRVSRLYYGAYNVRRAVALKYDGTFSTDSSDHQNVDKIPDAVNNAATYRVKLKNLREDRNLADYNHLAQETDLLVSPSDYEIMVTGFIQDAVQYLKSEGLTL